MLLPSNYPPADRGKLVVWGLLAAYPFGGMAWQVLHYLAGFRRLGFDVWYVEDSDRDVLDTQTLMSSTNWSPNVEYMVQQLEQIGLGDRWMFRVPGDPEQVLGGSKAALDCLYREADAVFNLCFSQEPREEHKAIRCQVLIETDPVEVQVAIAEGQTQIRQELDPYGFLFSYGENFGRPDCRVPIEHYVWHPTRPPVCVDWWETSGAAAAGAAITTVANWKHSHKDLVWQGELWRWSKDHEFRRFIRLPSRSPLPMEMALGAIGEDDVALLRRHGWMVTRANDLNDPGRYFDYIRASLGEFSVAKEQYVRPRSGWFSDRSVCYLAAGRPVILQKTGFENFIPTGEGLFAFDTEDDVAAALEAISSDYARQSAGARSIAQEYFGAEKVVGGILRTMGLM